VVVVELDEFLPYIHTARYRLISEGLEVAGRKVVIGVVLARK